MCGDFCFGAGDDLQRIDYQALNGMSTQRQGGGGGGGGGFTGPAAAVERVPDVRDGPAAGAVSAITSPNSKLIMVSPFWL